MKKMKNMKEWSYKEAVEYFRIPTNRILSFDALTYRNMSKHARTFDVRDSMGLSKHMFQGGWLILIDGPVCSGKTTWAKKIKNKNPNDIRIVDVELMSVEWLDLQLRMNIGNIQEQKRIVSSFEKKSSEFVKNNLEEMVSKNSENGKKTVVLTGCFLDPLRRAIIGNTLGRYFSNVAFLTIYERGEKLKEYQQKRDKELGMDEVNLKLLKETSSQNRFIKKMVHEDPDSLGIGCDVSLIINSNTVIY